MNKDEDIMSQLSLPQQKYIETIYELCREHEHAHSKSIAEKLSVKMPSVTEALRTLSALGLVNYRVRKAITLTDAGIKVAKMLDSRHRNLASFFTDILGCEKSRAERFACDIEHVIDCELNCRLGAFSEFIKNGPDSYSEMLKKFREQYAPNCKGER